MLTDQWRKSTRSHIEPGTPDCVEARRVADGVQVRHSQSPDGPALTFTPSEWVAFVAGVKDGEFDLPV